MNKKTIVRLIIGVMISMLLFGCGNKEEEKTRTPFSAVA